MESRFTEVWLYLTFKTPLSYEILVQGEQLSVAYTRKSIPFFKVLFKLSLNWLDLLTFFKNIFWKSLTDLVDSVLFFV